MKKLVTLLMIAAFLVPATIALAEEYPSGPIKMIVPYKPGGRSDITARILGKYLPKYLGTQMVVVNVAGASGTIGCKELLKSKPDGYTLLYHHESMLTAKTTGLVNFTWDAFTPICLTVRTVNIYVTGPDAPYSTWAELKAEAKKNPGKITVGTSVGSPVHLSYVLMNQDAGGTLRVATGGGDIDRISKIMGGHLAVTSASLPSVVSYIQSGKVKPLFLTSKDRSKFLPEVASWSDAGLPEEIIFNMVVYAPKNMPDDVVKKISEACQKISADPEYVKDIEKYFVEVTYKDTAETRRILKSEAELYEKLTEEAGLKKKK